MHGRLVVLSAMTPRTTEGGNHRFRVICCLHLQNKIETAGFSGTLIITTQTKQCHQEHLISCFVMKEVLVYYKQKVMEIE